jgi:hypothetical protein
MFLSFTGMGREVHVKIHIPVKDKNIVQNLNMGFPTHPCKR